MKLVSEDINDFLNEGIGLVKTDFNKSFDDESKQIIQNNKKFKGKDMTAKSILLYIQHMSKKYGGVKANDIKKFIFYSQPYNDSNTFDSVKHRGRYSSNLYIKYGKYNNLLDGWCKKLPDGRWYLDPDIKIEKPYYKLRKKNIDEGIGLAKSSERRRLDKLMSSDTYNNDLKLFYETPEISNLILKYNNDKISRLEATLRFIQYMSKINNGATPTEISKFLHYLNIDNGYTLRQPYDYKLHRGDISYYLYRGKEPIKKWARKLDNGKWYLDPSIEIKKPFWR